MYTKNNQKSEGGVRKVATFAVMVFSLCVGEAQTFTYRQFMDTLLSHNKALIAERLNIKAGEAEMEAAQVWQDPSLSLEYGNNSNWSMAMGRSWSVELSQSFSLGKIAARTRLAKQSLTATQAETENHVRELYAEASVLFLDALLARDLEEISKETWRNALALAASDSLRYARGEIAELDVLQSHLEAHLAHQEWMIRATEYHNLLSQMDALAGMPNRRTIGVEGELLCPTEEYALQALIDSALHNRADLAAARAGVAVSHQELLVARRERLPDIDLSIGVSHNSEVLNEMAPAPEFVGYTVGVGFPLPLSNLNRGSIRVAQIRAQQSELQTQALEQTVRSEVTCAYNSYQTARARANHFSTTLMEMARQVLEGRMYAYGRGESSLLEVISAQKTYNEVVQAHAECLHESMVALVELHRVIGGR